MRATRAVIFLSLIAVAAGCNSDPNCGTASQCVGDKPNGKPGTFESDLPGGQSPGAGEGGPTRGAADASSGTAAGAPPTAMPAPQSPDNTAGRADGAEFDDNKSADRAIVEADIIQLSGDRLFALSRISGLTVIDVSNPKVLQIIGHYRELPGQPFEMYLKGDVAILMFTDWGQYVPTEDGKFTWVNTSKVVALDVADPGQIGELGTFDVPGSISDSRVVGDVLYIVGFENGYCWRCEQNRQTTAVSSLDIADPHAIEKVDELRYGDSREQAYSWQRSITVTNQRMYVAGPEYGQNGPIGSRIQVIDISDPAGDLVEGAVLQARGQISSRWQMDEYDGVLRVVSQPGQWRTTELPMLQTFKVISSKEFQTLARLDIVIPKSETLRSARFDGTRGYLITALQQDPLFTLDLTDPAKPRQVGELEMPGWIYHMEPRGDRVLGLGYDQGNPEGSITVSLFDVTDLAKPQMLSRVNFGGNWGSLPEDQDRIHKVFRVLTDDGLILVPFSGYQQSSLGDYCGGKSIGGVQLVDYANDTLKLRGNAPSTGEARRALLHNDHLFSVSDHRVEAFDITDRSKPKATSQVIMANTVAYAARLDGDLVARVTTPNWDGRWFVEVVDSAHADDLNTKLGEVSLNGVFNPDAKTCDQWWNINSYHVDGSKLYLAYEGYRYQRTGNGERETGVIVVDAKDPEKPEVVGHKSWSTPQNEQSNWYMYYGDYSYGGFGRTEQQLWLGTTLAFLEQRYSYYGKVESYSTRLHVIDLSDPKNITATTLPLAAGQMYSGLIGDGDRVLTSRYPRLTQPQNATGTVRFYVDAFDVSNPKQPRALPSVNVPGVLVHYESGSGRAVTSELRRTPSVTLTAEECYRRFANAEFTYADTRNFTNESPGTCVGYLQSLHLVELRQDGAVLDDTLRLAENENIAGWSAGDGRLFATVSRGGYYYYPRGGPIAVDCAGPGCGGGVSAPDPVKLIVLGGFDARAFEVGRLEVETDPDNRWYGWWGTPPIHAHGQRALMLSNGDAAVIDASDLADVHITKTEPLLGSAGSVEIKDGVALITLYERGLQWLEL